MCTAGVVLPYLVAFFAAAAPGVLPTEAAAPAASQHSATEPAHWPVGHAGAPPAAAPFPALTATSAPGPGVAQARPQELLLPELKPVRTVRVPGQLVDLMVHGGVSIPGGHLYRNARSAATYGGGLGKEIVFDRHFALRGTLAYGYARHKARSPQLAGHVGLHMATLQVDVLLGAGRLRPFVGGGVGLYPWTGHITQRSDGQKNARSVGAFGGHAVAGLDLRLSEKLSLAPQGSWRRLTGSFSEMMWGAEIAARWRL